MKDWQGYFLIIKGSWSHFRNAMNKMKRTKLTAKAQKVRAAKKARVKTTVTRALTVRRTI